RDEGDECHVVVAFATQGAPVCANMRIRSLETREFLIDLLELGIRGYCEARAVPSALLPTQDQLAHRSAQVVEAGKTAFRGLARGHEHSGLPISGRVLVRERRGQRVAVDVVCDVELVDVDLYHRGPILVAVGGTERPVVVTTLDADLASAGRVERQFGIV